MRNSNQIFLKAFGFYILALFIRFFFAFVIAMGEKNGAESVIPALLGVIGFYGLLFYYFKNLVLSLCETKKENRSILIKIFLAIILLIPLLLLFLFDFSSLILLTGNNH